MFAFGLAVNPRADSRPVRLSPNRLHLQPVVLERALAAQQLRNVVDAIHHHVQIAVIVEITDRATTPQTYEGPSAQSRFAKG